MNDKIEKSATQARQGQRGRPILAVLLASLALAVVLVLGLFFWNDQEDPASLGVVEGTSDS
ncbi:MAG: hypothetical protein ACFB6S_07845 [Geminicoccaceae bacterium]